MCARRGEERVDRGGPGCVGVTGVGAGVGGGGVVILRYG